MSERVLFYIILHAVTLLIVFLLDCALYFSLRFFHLLPHVVIVPNTSHYIVNGTDYHTGKKGGGIVATIFFIHLAVYSVIFKLLEPYFIKDRYLEVSEDNNN